MTTRNASTETGEILDEEAVPFDDDQPFTPAQQPPEERKFLDFPTLVAAVDTARRGLDAIAAALDIEYQDYLQRTAHLRQAVELAKASLKDAEDELRLAAIARFRETGIKKPFPGVAIRMMKRLVYDTEQMRDWAFREATTLLILDEARFKSVAARLNPPGLQIVEEPQATIATAIGRD